MNAAQALKLTQESLKGPVIKPLLEAIYRQIEAAAKKGQSSITNPWKDQRTPHPSPEEEEAIWEVLRSQGYKVERYLNDDPGHYAGRSSYHKISWF